MLLTVDISLYHCLDIKNKYIKYSSASIPHYWQRMFIFTHIYIYIITYERIYKVWNKANVVWRSQLVFVYLTGIVFKLRKGLHCKMADSNSAIYWTSSFTERLHFSSREIWTFCCHDAVLLNVYPELLGYTASLYSSTIYLIKKNTSW